MAEVNLRLCCLLGRSVPVVYPSPDGRQHLVVGGEGSLMFYRFFMHTPESGAVPMYFPPQPVCCPLSAASVCLSLDRSGFCLCLPPTLYDPRY